MKRFGILIITIFILSSCGRDSHLKDVSFISEFNKSSIRVNNYFKRTNVHYSFKSYFISYSTKDYDGSEINASGVVSIPDINKEKFNIVINCHPTIFLNSKAPSKREQNSLNPAILFSGLSGFITLEPDYIGFGKSKSKEHLYFVKAQSSRALVDFLKAAKDFLHMQGINIDEKENYYLTGFSEGAYVALSSLKTLEESGFNIKLTAPISGAYILEPLADKLLHYKRIQKPSIITAIANSYIKANDMWQDELFNSKYIALINSLFDKKHSKEQIDNALPKNLSGSDGLFKEEFIKNYSNSWLKEELKRNSALSYNLNSKITFLHCLGDEAIPFESALYTKMVLKNYYFKDSKLVAVEPFISQNSKTKLRLKHKECALAAYKTVNFLFDLDAKMQLK